MKVAIITPTLSGRGGEETVISELMSAKVVQSNNIQIELIILGRSYSKGWLSKLGDSLKITQTENEIKNFVYLAQLIHQEKYQKIICISRKSVLYSYLIRKFQHFDYKIYSWLHFDLTRVHTTFLKLADYHLAISDGIRDQLIQKEIGNLNNIFTIYNPVQPSKSTIYHAGNNKLVYVGRITFKGQKNIKELIDNVASLPFTNWSLEIIGDGDDKNKCQSYVHEHYLEIEKNFFWDGWQNNPWTEIKSADSLILTSAYEGLPMVLLEAISRGLPCLASKVLGPTSVIQPSVNGELYKAGYKKDFALKLQKILNSDYEPDLVKKSISKFYINSYLKRFINILKDGDNQ